MRGCFVCLFLALSLVSLSGQCKKLNEKSDKVLFGDPFIMLYDGVYYAYGTSSPEGIRVFVSDNMKTWSDPEKGQKKLALHKEDVWADRGFWAPEVYFINGRFYMYYTGNESICVATSDSPLGPFTEEVKKPMLENEKSIDNSLFIDDDGKAYLFFDRFNDGLNIWVAELTPDLLNIKPETMHKCIAVSQEWERVKGRVNEGPFVMKHNGVYYMTYSGNDFRSQNYGLGFATATDIMGKWTKYEQNPIYQNVDTLVGIGHSAMFRDKKGKLRIVFHAHADRTKVNPRAMYISSVSFEKAGDRERMVISPDYFTPKLKD